MEEQNVAFRLKGFMDSMSLSPSQFADTCGIPRPTLSQLLGGRNKKISDIIVGQIHRAFPRLSVLWLMFGEGPMLTADVINSGTEDSELSSKDFISDQNTDKINASGKNYKSFNSSGPLNGPEILKLVQDGSGNSAESNVRALNTPDINSQLIDNRLIEAEYKIAELQKQIDKFRKFPRKVTQITVYYDDSTFEAFFPKIEN